MADIFIYSYIYSFLSMLKNYSYLKIANELINVYLSVDLFDTFWQSSIKQIEH